MCDNIHSACASFVIANRANRRKWTANAPFTQRQPFTEMNRWSSTDSKQSLDAVSRKRDSVTMIAQHYHLYVERTDVEKNMARFYAMAIEPNLFGEACLTRRWGRIGTRGQTMIHHFEQEKDAVILFLDLVRTKKSRGYSTILQPRHVEGLETALGRRHPQEHRIDSAVSETIVAQRSNG
jgi:predicted DNA-binding WGR domain protein